jgi:dTDP-4-dehydrorhamnose reductase
MTKILVIGKTGQVGWELQRTLATLGKVIALDRHGMDLVDPDSIRSAIRSCSPQIIVNAAAYTAVDQAESEPDLALAINGIAPSIMAEEAKKLGALLVHYSTDYVFDGAKSEPYTEDDQPNPLNAYGSSKLAGERAVAASGVRYLIFRTSWIYGARGKNFLRTILRLAQERDELRIVDDQVGAPTWCRAIAEATAQALVCAQARDAPNANGTYHLSTAGSTSWCGFAKAILECAGRSCKVVPIPSNAYPLPARRPANSVLSNAKLNARFGITLPDWSCALKLCLQQD